MAEKADERFMRMALELARQGQGETSPNPLVGAVIIKDGKIVGKGYHKRVGGAHAEIEALRSARESARGGTLYVNLEPCCHYGRTNPCTDAILEAGLKEVVYAITDPNPRVRGQGARRLKSAGVAVRSGVLAKRAEELNEVYLKYIQTGLPFVILKTAQSLDGRVATVTGDSRWISGEPARKFAHQLRADADAVAIGAGTLRADNPQLTVRLVAGRNPYRIIIARNIRFSPSLHLFANNQDGKTIVATGEEGAARLRSKDLIVWQMRSARAGIVLKEVLKRTGEFQISSLLVEGGGRLATSFLRERLVDRHYVVIAPMTIGRGIDSVGDIGVRKLRQSIQYRNPNFTLCGEDLLFSGYPVRS